MECPRIVTGGLEFLLLGLELQGFPEETGGFLGAGGNVGAFSITEKWWPEQSGALGWDSVWRGGRHREPN